ncbi:MAG: hypothetical protein K9M80_08410 [Candidatus Marinimicrobia bacterium]|nr:hypothetical protein [Candidatus Neomarinimicrobiota bacterium]
MKKSTIFIINLILLFQFGWTEQFTNKSVLRNEFLNCSNNFRISDILQNIEGGSFYTIGGYTYNLVFNGLNAYQHQNFSLYIDDHKISRGLLGNKNINSLPINLNSIDSVTIINTPLLYKGNFENNGIIRIYTNSDHSNEQNFYFKNRLMLGSETKDSGPYQYTRYQSPNVDKIGADYSSVLGYKIGDQSALVNLHWRQNIYTDWSINKRLTNLNSKRDWPMLIEYGGAVQLKGSFFDNNYSLLLSHVDANRMYYFFEPAGHEFPLNYLSNYFGVSIDRNLNPNFDFNINLKYESESINKLMQEKAVANYWALENFNATFELLSKEPGYIQSLGGGLQYTSLLSSRGRMQDRFIPNMYLKFHFEPDLVDHISISQLFKFYRNNVYENYGINIIKRFNPDNKLELMLASSRDIMPLNSYWYWNDKGYLFERQQINYNTETFSRNQKYNGDITWTKNINEELSVKLSILARYFENYPYRHQTFNLNKDKFTFSSPEIYYNAVDGFVKGFKAIFNWRPLPAIHSSLDFTILDPLSQDQFFTDAWHKIPTKIVNYKIFFKPASSFSLQFNLHHNSKTIWHEFENISGIEYFSTFKENFIYSHKLPGINRMDIKMQKLLLNRSLALNLFLKNISNQRIYYHPVGAAFDMSMYFGIEYNF